MGKIERNSSQTGTFKSDSLGFIGDLGMNLQRALYSKYIWATLALSFLGLSAADCAPAKAPSKAVPAKAPAAAANPIFNNYVNALRSKIDKNWNPPQGTNHVVLSVQVANDGSVSNLNLSSSPKNGEAEQKASDAFNGAQPLTALPGGASASLTVTFDSTADQWDSKASVSVRMDPNKSAPATQAAPAGDSAAPSAEQSPADSEKK